MNFKEYSLSKDGEKKVTENIKVKELRCKDGTDYIKIDYVVVCLAQYIRDIFKSPFNINSAYRTKAYNARPDVGGTSGSKHLMSCAIDGYIKNVSPQLIGNILYSMGLKRIGVYSNFIHFDTDTKPVWLSKGNFIKIQVPYLNRLLKKGDSNYLVTIIQYKLNLMGYNCGVEDGIFGNKTLIALKNFQSKNLLIADGIVGIKTWNKMFN